MARKLEERETHRHLNWSRDQLLISMAETMQHLVFNCSPAGAHEITKELDGVLNEFKRTLDTIAARDRRGNYERR